jgi:hypothetical protein
MKLVGYGYEAWFMILMEEDINLQMEDVTKGWR